MMTRRLTSRSLLALTLFAACADSGDRPTTINESPDSRVIRAETGTLTDASAASRETIVRDFLDERALGGTGQLDLVSAVERNGYTHVMLEQRVNGLRVIGGYVKGAVDEQGRLVQVIDATITAPVVIAKAAKTERDALAAAMAELGYDGAVPAQANGNGNVMRFIRTADFHRDPTVERVVYRDPDSNQLANGFLVETWSLVGNQLDHTIVDAAGKVVSVQRRTNNDSYNVYTNTPATGPQTVVTGLGVWLSGTTLQSSVNITGNNGHAYLDADKNNSPDAGGTTVSNGNFLTAANLGASPSTAGNKEVAVQNLFYLTNVTHDILYSHGFTESAGNFQADNFGLGGAAGDAVNAEAQDGSGTDNANFATPNDGSAPRMQMYLWTGASPNAFVGLSAPAGAPQVGAWYSSFGAAPTATGTAQAGIVYKGDGCAAMTGLAGKIALVDRGTCNFTQKVLNAQTGGAIAVLIANNDSASPDFGFSPGGTEKRVKIPSGMISYNSGLVLRGYTSPVGSFKKGPTPLQIDGDLDAGIVYHEYGHGLTWRMVGDMSGPLAGALGEGASDVNAFLITGDPIMGAYAYSNPLGIRRYPYNNYQLTYAAVDGAEVHNDGEVYAAAMWRVYQNYLAAGLTASDLQDDFVGGFDFTPAKPTFEQMRDGTVSAATAHGRQCLVWRGFASIGIGVGSSATVSRRGVVTITQSSAVPAGCTP